MTSDSPGLHRVTERQLREPAKFNTIKRATIIKTPEGYGLIISLSWRGDSSVLYTQRMKPRMWASLDRLIMYLSELAPSIRRVDLVLAGTTEMLISA